MDDLARERRKNVRHELKTRVRLFNENTGAHEDACLENINSSGMYLITRCRLLMHQAIEIIVPCNPGEDTIKLRGRVIRIGSHRSWGVFSYACRILH